MNRGSSAGFIKQVTEVENFITEIHVSPYTHHVAYKIDGGDEKFNILVQNYVIEEEVMPTPGKGKKNFGGWHKSGIHYFQLNIVMHL